MGRALSFIFQFFAARARLAWFEFSPDLYRKFHVALALPRWKEFPFYRALKGGLEHFPEMSKTKSLANFILLNRFGARYEECLKIGQAQERDRNFLTNNSALPYSVGLSSGTSGRRGVFLTTEQERVRWAATILAHAGFISLWKRQRIAFFLRANSPLYEQVGSKRLEFRFFDLAQDLETLLPKLRAFAPTVLLGPPALLSALREAESSGKIISPDVIISVADKLEKDTKQRLERHFGHKVFEVYQATEGFLGISCPAGTMHLNEDLHFFERRFVDDDRTSFEPVISDYFRSSQAIVRFHLDDVLVLQDGCVCGSRRQAIREIRGRSDDVLLFTGRGGTRMIILPDFVRHAIQNHLEHDLDFKVVQEGEARLHIQLESEPNADALSRASSELRAYLEAQGIKAPALDWSFGLRRGLGDKRKRVEHRA